MPMLITLVNVKVKYSYHHKLKYRSRAVDKMAKSVNVTTLLRKREYDLKSPLRSNQKIMRNIVCQKDTKFVKVWERHSHHPIAYECGKLYFDNFRTWYHVHGADGKPVKFFKLPQCPASQKIEDCLIAQCMLSVLPLEYKGYKGSVYCLTAHNWLERYDVDTGELLQKVYLSPRVKFRQLQFANDMDSIVLKSTHQRITQLARDAGVVHNLLMVLAILQIFPLEFVGMLEITKNIFGKDISDAMITHGILIVMHQGGYVRLYSFEEIINVGRKYTAELYSPCRENTGSFTGGFPSGLPLNIQLASRPPLLFEVRCSDHDLTLGGFPWHYIISPHGHRGRFHVCSLRDKNLAANGVLDMEITTVEPDKCFFHPDDSGRILHIGANEVKVLSINQLSFTEDEQKRELERKSRKHTLMEDFSIQCRKVDAQSAKPFDGVMYTSSGRQIKRRPALSGEILDNVYEAIQNVDYENELDLLTVTAIQSEGDGYRGMLHIHNNSTGEHIKTVTLDETWAEGGAHTVTLDMDILVHIAKAPMRRFSCYVYRLDRSVDDEQIIRRRRSRKGSFHVNYSPSSETSHVVTRLRRTPNRPAGDRAADPGDSSDTPDPRPCQPNLIGQSGSENEARPIASTSNHKMQIETVEAGTIADRDSIDSVDASASSSMDSSNISVSIIEGSSRTRRSSRNSQSSNSSSRPESSRRSRRSTQEHSYCRYFTEDDHDI